MAGLGCDVPVPPRQEGIQPNRGRAIMNLFQAIGSGFRNYGNFHGRALRSEYWYWALFAGVASNIAPYFDAAFFPDRSVVALEIVGRQFGLIYLLTALALILPGVAVSA